MADNQQIRSFVAIELPHEVKAALADVQAKLKLTKYDFVKWVEPESIHITLKFLGNVARSRVPEIVPIMERAARGVSPFQLEFRTLGAFPNLGQPRVLWVAIAGETGRLLEFQQRIDAALTLLGFMPEPRPFSPHVTLARVRERASPSERRDFGELVKKTPFEANYFVQVKTISLMRSQLLPSGAVYTRLAEVELHK